MIKVVIEVRPANSRKVSLAGVMSIENDETGSSELGNYEIALSVGSDTARARLEGWPRDRTAPELVARAFSLLYPSLPACPEQAEGSPE